MSTKARKIVFRVGLSLGISLAIFITTVLILTLAIPTTTPHGESSNLKFQTLTTDTQNLPTLQTYTARDGQELGYRHYDSADAPQTLILLHGSAYHSAYLEPLAHHLAEQGIANVYTPDFRGHGPDPANRGDVDYMGQLEDDISDLISYVRERENGPIVLGGHSSGGGTVIRYAGGDHAETVDRYLLLAPYIHHDSETQNPTSGWTNVNLPRMIGLSILNTFRITAFNHQDVLSFNMPNDYRDGTETLHYSYTLYVSMHPRDDYHSDIAALGDKTLLVVGSDDASFTATAYEPLFARDDPEATVDVLPGLSHFGVVTDPSAHHVVGDWLEQGAQN